MRVEKKWDFAVRIATKARLKANLSKFCSLLVFFFQLMFFPVIFKRFSPCLVDIAMRLSALCAVLSLLVVLFLISEVTSCYVKVNGCSIPGKLPFFYKRTFRNACNKHDVCYYCVRLASFSY